MKCCPTCGQTLPEKVPLGIKFTGPIKPRLFARLHKAGKHGVHVAQLAEFLYGDDPNGGPIDPYNTISVHVIQMNHALKKDNLKIANTGRGRCAGGHYFLTKL